ncbi:hypothetical protein HGO38_30020 [Rhizobium sp. CG5]|uniref:hypothetical protein n=1 Tax=Rhizobium sp. CG5 TaxID=2726076 RepID=UPI00203467B0|nr:hypothetical protein [Rhizobium sp. CG5]MCM2477688.1 hypothetical protein [Rhizobium sp. CG5]
MTTIPSLSTRSVGAASTQTVELSNSSSIASAAAARPAGPPAPQDGAWQPSMLNLADAAELDRSSVETLVLDLETVRDLVGAVKEQLELALDEDNQRGAIDATIADLTAQIRDVVTAGRDNGLELGFGQPPRDRELIASVATDEEGNLAVETATLKASQTVLVGRGNADDGMLTRAVTGRSENGTAYSHYLIDAGSLNPASANARRIAVSDETSAEALDGMIAATDRMVTTLDNAIEGLSDLSERMTGVTVEAAGLLQDVADADDLDETDLEDRAFEASTGLAAAGMSIANRAPSLFQGFGA